MSENMEASEHSENLYGYQDSESNKNNEPPKESNAIRRSIGTGENPFHFQDHNSFQPQENEQSQENKIDLRKPPSTIQEEYNPPKPKPTNYIKPQSLTTSKSISNNNSNTEPCPKSSIIFLFLLMLQILAVVILATAYKRGDGDPNNFGKKFTSSALRMPLAPDWQGEGSSPPPTVRKVGQRGLHLITNFRPFLT